MEIGEKLIEARRKKNLTLDDIQEMTKIQKRYLQAIEQENYEALPGRFYARAFIKEYAQAIELDYHELLTDFDEHTININEEKPYTHTRLSRSRRNRTLRGAGTSIFALLPTVIVIILIIGIIFIAWTLYQQTINNTELPVEDRQENDEIIRSSGDKAPDEETDDTTSDSTQQESDAGEEQTGVTAGKFETIDANLENVSVPEVRFNYSGEQVELTYDVTETTYIEIKGASETVYFSGELNPESSGENFDISSEERVYFNVGYSPGISLQFNGIELNYPISPTEKVHQKLWVELNRID